MTPKVGSQNYYYGFLILVSLLVRKADSFVMSGLRVEVGKHGRKIRCALVTCVLFMLSWSTHSTIAEERTYNFNIPATDAATALNRFAEQTGAILLFPYDKAEALRSNAVVGQYNLQNALDILLEDTGLSGGLSEKQMIRVSMVEADHSDKGEREMNLKEKHSFGIMEPLVVDIRGQ